MSSTTVVSGFTCSTLYYLVYIPHYHPSNVSPVTLSNIPSPNPNPFSPITLTFPLLSHFLHYLVSVTSVISFTTLVTTVSLLPLLSWLPLRLPLRSLPLSLGRRNSQLHCLGTSWVTSTTSVTISVTTTVSVLSRSQSLLLQPPLYFGYFSSLFYLGFVLGHLYCLGYLPPTSPLLSLLSLLSSP